MPMRRGAVGGVREKFAANPLTNTGSMAGPLSRLQVDDTWVSG
jgi:hypothetical protein